MFIISVQQRDLTPYQYRVTYEKLLSCKKYVDMLNKRRGVNQKSVPFYQIKVHSIIDLKKYSQNLSYFKSFKSVKRPDCFWSCNIHLQWCTCITAVLSSKHFCFYRQTNRQADERQTNRKFSYAGEIKCAVNDFKKTAESEEILFLTQIKFVRKIFNVNLCQCWLHIPSPATIVSIFTAHIVAPLTWK